MKLRFGDCVFDTDRRVLGRAGQLVHLTPKAFQLLTILTEARPRAVGKDEIQQALWPHTYVTDANLPGLINELRSAVGDSARQPRYIKTLHGFGYAFTAALSTAEESLTQSILVLPFHNQAANAGLDYLCDGITESILNAFSRLPRYRVIARSTAFRWKGTSEEPESIGRQLAVDVVIAGRVDQSEQRLAIQVEAVDVATGTQIWGEKFHPLLDDVLQVEEEIAREIARALLIRQPGGDDGRLIQRYTSNPRAHDAYLRGRFHWNKRTGKWLQTAIAYFEEAIAADAGYALPHAGLADVFVAIGSRDLIAPREAFTRALASAARALELAPSLAEAQTSMAAINEVHLGRWEEAGRRYRRAIELNPSYATAYQWYALHFARQQMFERAEDQMARALDIDPLSIIILTNCGLISYLARDWELAARRAERALELESNYEGALLVLGATHVMVDNCEAAIDCYRTALMAPGHQTHTLASLGYALARSGRRSEALEVVEQLHALRRAQHVSSSDFALVFVGMGLHETALEWFESALQERSGWLVYLATDARVDPLRADPRFRMLLHAVGLTQSDA